jgi:hypothetical protein
MRTRTTELQMQTRQWLGIFGGQGHGYYRGELATALKAVGTYLAASDLRLVVRGRGYTLLEQPQVQAVLTQTVPVTTTCPGSQVSSEVFAIPNVALGPDQPDAQRCRVILTRHGWTGEPVAVGKRVGTWG